MSLKHLVIWLPGNSPTQPRPSPALDDHAALAAAPAELGSGGGGHLPGEPGGQSRAGRHQGRGRRRQRRAATADLCGLRDQPAQYTLRSISTLVDIHTRVSDLYSSPHDQIAQQLRLTIETIKERQELELINSPEYGLLAQATPEQTIQTLAGAPTPDDLDALITKVWKTPSFFLTHPLGIAAFGREATYRVPPPVVSLFGAQFITWRGIPLIPSDKVPVEDGKTKFILVRTGEERQGVVGLFQPGLVGEQAPGLSVRFTGINQSAIATYLVTLYTSLAVLTDDALAVLDDVAVDQFHEYK